MGMLKHVDFEVPAFGEFGAGPTVWANYRDALMALEPLAYWRLGDGDEVAADEAGEFPGTYEPQSSGNWAGGSFSGSLVFRNADQAAVLDGASGYIHAPELPDSGTNANVTLLAWVRPSVVNGSHAIIANGRHGSYFHYRMILSNGVLAAGNSNTDRTLGGSVAAGAMAMLATVYSGSTVSGYVDGIFVGSDSIGTVGHATGSGELAIGRRPMNNSELFAGTIDEVAVFYEALSATTIRDLYWRGRGVVSFS